MKNEGKKLYKEINNCRGEHCSSILRRNCLRKEYKFKEKAITLISLVITVVILIILASVAIYLGLSNNGIFNRAKEAKETTNKQTATELINLKITNCQINKYAEKQEMPTLKELSLALNEDKEIQYVTETTQTSSTKYEVGDNPTSIYTKLKEYPYEFEINGQLQLASINGIKIATTLTESSKGYSLLWTGIGDTENIEYKFINKTMNVDNYDFVLIEYYQSNLEDAFNSSVILSKNRIKKGEFQNIALYGYGTRYTTLHFTDNGYIIDAINGDDSCYEYITNIYGINL